MRILVTADLHAEVSGLETIRRLVAGMSRESPDLVILAGDLGNPSRVFDQCLGCFARLGAPVAVLPGNHDLWASLGETSALLLYERLQEVTEGFGFHWLEGGPLRLGNVAVAGSIAWYDYSSRDQELAQTDHEVLVNKPRHSLDAVKIDWDYSDQEFAALCRERLEAQLKDLEADPAIRSVLAVTHVPVFEAQLQPLDGTPGWALRRPYYGHATLGELIRPFAKVTHVLSGHTHAGMTDQIERAGARPIATAVVPSDFGRPRWLTLDPD
jgi:predicted MPP superfamily phosphohydrolase